MNGALVQEAQSRVRPMLDSRISSFNSAFHRVLFQFHYPL